MVAGVLVTQPWYWLCWTKLIWSHMLRVDIHSWESICLALLVLRFFASQWSPCYACQYKWYIGEIPCFNNTAIKSFLLNYYSPNLLPYMSSPETHIPSLEIAWNQWQTMINCFIYKADGIGNEIITMILTVMLCQHGPPTSKDFLTLEKGRSITNTVP